MLLEVDGARVEVTISGSGARACLLLHGWGCSAQMMESVTLLEAPDAARAEAFCELRQSDAYFIIGVVGEDWLVLMTRDGTVGYAPRELFWEGNG